MKTNSILKRKIFVARSVLVHIYWFGFFWSTSFNLWFPYGFYIPVQCVCNYSIGSILFGFASIQSNWTFCKHNGSCSVCLFACVCVCVCICSISASLSHGMAITMWFGISQSFIFFLFLLQTNIIVIICRFWNSDLKLFPVNCYTRCHSLSIKYIFYAIFSFVSFCFVLLVSSWPIRLNLVILYAGPVGMCAVQVRPISSCFVVAVVAICPPLTIHNLHFISNTKWQFYPIKNWACCRVCVAVCACGAQS